MKMLYRVVKRRRATREDEDDNNDDRRLYCSCQKPAKGDMILCENCGEWFHFNCAGITAETDMKASWLCFVCVRVTKSEAKVTALQKKLESLINNFNSSQPKDNALDQASGLLTKENEYVKEQQKELSEIKNRFTLLEEENDMLRKTMCEQKRSNERLLEEKLKETLLKQELYNELSEMKKRVILLEEENDRLRKMICNDQDSNDLLSEEMKTLKKSGGKKQLEDTVTQPKCEGASLAPIVWPKSLSLSRPKPLSLPKINKVTSQTMSVGASLAVRPKSLSLSQNKVTSQTMSVGASLVVRPKSLSLSQNKKTSSQGPIRKKVYIDDEDE